MKVYVVANTDKAPDKSTLQLDWSGSVLQAKSNTLYKRYDAHVAVLYLIRRDGCYIGFWSRPVKPEALLEYFSPVFLLDRRHAQKLDAQAVAINPYKHSRV